MTISLALKYRPKTFDDLVEQGPIRQILEHQLKTKTFPNSALFTGPAGTGKTTTSRIVAREINEGKGNPIEIDGASNNGVDNIRNVIDGSKFKSLSGEYKCYIIDECHMLSIGAWNAMLKLLEEPPAQTIFLLCTTDPQKIPATILSRVQRYDFQKISFKGVVDRLKYILDSEMASENELGITSYQMEALEYIAKVANGGMRDAITLLDKCLSYATDLTVESTIKALGTVNYDLLFNLLESLYNKQEKSVIDILEQTYKEGIDLKLFLKNFLQFILELCKYDTCRDFSYVYIPNTYASKLDGYPKDIYMYCRKLLNSLVQWNSEIKWETNPKTLLESRFMLELINDNRSN